jgi:hypothetical protein
MDLRVDPGEVAEVLTSLRELVFRVILPRLTDLEEEVRLLRKVTWPVCQGIREKTQLDDIECKREFLSELDAEEVFMLLKLKSKGLLFEECHKLKLAHLDRYKQGDKQGKQLDA